MYDSLDQSAPLFLRRRFGSEASPTLRRIRTMTRAERNRLLLGALPGVLGVGLVLLVVITVVGPRTIRPYEKVTSSFTICVVELRDSVQSGDPPDRSMCSGCRPGYGLKGEFRCEDSADGSLMMRLELRSRDDELAYAYCTETFPRLDWGPNRSRFRSEPAPCE